MHTIATLLLVAAAGAGPKVVVPHFATQGELDDGTAAIISELVLTELQNGQGIQALGPDDVARIMDLEAQQQLMGCETDGCFAELVGALDADFVLAGQVGRLGTLYVLTLKAIDPAQAQVIGRVSRTLKSIEEIATTLPEVLGGLVAKMRAAHRPAASTASAASASAPAPVPVAAAAPPPTELDQARRDATRVVDRVLRTVEKNDRKGFEKMVHPAALKVTPLPLYYFTELRKLQRGRKRIGLCPGGKFEAKDGSGVVDRLDGEGLLVLCLAIDGGKEPAAGSIRLKQAEHGWRVYDWQLPK
ncbi:MAG: hypothetical protein P1V51_17675 [Deltaproteobacteria bacterium]|nr:hypothetical protein [Deltaproteobacteria bacterium]